MYFLCGNGARGYFQLIEIADIADLAEEACAVDELQRFFRFRKGEDQTHPPALLFPFHFQIAVVFPVQLPDKVKTVKGKDGKAEQDRPEKKCSDSQHGARTLFYLREPEQCRWRIL